MTLTRDRRTELLAAAPLLAGVDPGGLQRIADRTGQVQSRGQRAHGVDLRPPPLPALQRAHGVHRKARNRRELLLCVARGLAKCLQPRAE